MPFQTECKNCVFRVNINNDQVGCSHNRINKFIDAGVKVEKELDFYVIDRVCNLIRNPEWKDSKEDRKTNLEIIARAEVVKRTALFIHFDCSNNLKDLSLFLAQIRNQTLKPLYVVVSYEDADKNTSYTDIRKMLMEDFQDLPWRLEVPVNPTGVPRQSWNNYSNKYRDADFFALFFPTDRLYNGLFEDIDRAANDELLRIGMVVDDYGNSLIINKDFWFALNGDNPCKVSYNKLEDNKEVPVLSENVLDTFESKLSFIEQEDYTHKNWTYKCSQISPSQHLLLL